MAKVKLSKRSAELLRALNDGPLTTFYSYSSGRYLLHQGKHYRNSAINSLKRHGFVTAESLGDRYDTEHRYTITDAGRVALSAYVPPVEESLALYYVHTDYNGNVAVIEVQCVDRDKTMLATVKAGRAFIINKGDIGTKYHALPDQALTHFISLNCDRIARLEDDIARYRKNIEAARGLLKAVEVEQGVWPAELCK